LKQLYYYFGSDVLRRGLKSYFKKYAFKNTELKDFLQELSKAAITVGIKEDLMKWSLSWLESSGINIIKTQFDEENGFI